MKLLVFAHTPPPHHGQSYMVQLMLEGLGGDQRRVKAGTGRNSGGVRPSAGAAGTASGHALEHPNALTPPNVAAPGDGRAPLAPNSDILCYHVNARLSQKLEDIGDLRIGKFILLLGYCLEAVWCRFRYGVTNFYYIPAPGKRSALYRDWLVMLICRPFFKRVILHWHAAGLAKWLETAVQIRSRALTYRAMKKVDLSIVLSRYNRADAEKLFSQRIQVVGNGIPDPCPEFARLVLPRRRARLAARKKLLSGQLLGHEDLLHTGEDPQVVKVLYMAHCTREKGLFDTLAGVGLAREGLKAAHSPLSVRVLVTGNFVTAQEKEEFEELLAQPDAAQTMEYLGFVSGEQKNKMLREADIFCFPTYYQNENQPVNLIEAVAFGLPILTTRWRSIPELFPRDYPGLVEVRSPIQIAAAILKLLSGESGEGFRDLFLGNFTLERHISGLAEAFRQLERTEPGQVAEPMPARAS